MSDHRSGCPIASALDLVGDKWTLVILRSMVMGARSYSALLAAPERISTNILADRLHRMVATGLIEKQATRRGGTCGSYTLTAKGAALLPTLQALARWGETHLEDRWQAPASFYAARAEMLVA
jgi:DNA-binding HxlR family transcriptional regulator